MALSKLSLLPVLLLYVFARQLRNFGPFEFPNYIAPHYTSATSTLDVAYDAPSCYGWAPLFCAHNRGRNFRFRCCPQRHSTACLLLLLVCGDIEPNPGPTKGISVDRSKAREAEAGRPLMTRGVVSKNDIRYGDHIMVQTSREPCRRCFESAIVSCVNEHGDIEVIANTQFEPKGVKRVLCSFVSLKEKNVCVVQYSKCRYSADEAVKRAEQRLQMKDNRYHVLYNSSHHFATWAKIGKENPLTEITKDMQYEGNPTLDPVLTKRSLASLNDVHPGDHLMTIVARSSMSPVFDQHCLVKDIDLKKGTYTAYFCKGRTVSTDTRHCKADGNTFCIEYGGGAYVYPAEKAIENAEKFSSKWDSSADFVTAMKTGKKQPKNENYPKEKIHRLEQMKPGDHIIIEPSKEHLLVVDAAPRENLYVAYTTDSSGQVKKVEHPWKKNVGISRVSYRIGTFAPVLSINNAEKQDLSLSSDEFVTMMKIGKPYCLLQQCLFTPDNGVCSYTPISPHTAVDEGDHIIIRDESSGKYNSIFIYKHISDFTFTVMPSPNDCNSLYGQVDLTQFHESYRINYRESLPADQALIRACSPQGEEKLRKHTNNPCVFISWAKIGKQISINQLLDQGNLSPEIVQLPPGQYKKISLDEIDVGDHLIQKQRLYWFHFMVTERTEDPRQMKIIYCFRTSVKEEVMTLNPDKLFKIRYTECLPTETAIERARSQIHTRNYSPWARMQFVCWAKTGSDKGVEIDFLARSTRPVTKSTILSFGQLNPGDYLVKDEGTVKRVHHFLVTEVHSPIHCFAIESWNTPGWFGRVRRTEVILDEKYSFYRINYDDHTCIASDEAIKTAQSYADNGTVALPRSAITRERFVNYIKTGDTEKMDISQLSDDRFFLQRIAVESALELKRGDHLESEMQKSKLPTDGLAYTIASGVRDKKPYHHMMVVDAVNERRCTVIHFSENPWEKRNEVNEEEIDLFLEGRNVFRIHYPERIDPEYSMIILNGIRNNPNYKKYSVMYNNCEHLIMKATTRHHMSVQVNDGIHKALQQGKHALKPLGNALGEPIHKGAAKGTAKTMSLALNRAPNALKISAKTGSKIAGKGTAATASKSALNLGYRAAVGGATIGIVGGIAVGVNLLIETPVLTRGLYKLYRQRRFSRITDNEYKNKATRLLIKSANTVIGAVAGTIGGQAAIPVPVLGAAIGATVGSMVGEFFGHLEGKYISKKVTPIKM